jgi:type I restriction enzyme S subunit
MTGIQYKLGDICDFQGGSQPPKSNFIQEPKEGYIRLLQIRDFKSDDKAVYIPNVKKNRICESDDIMIGRYGASVGQIHRGKAGAYNVALIKAIPNTDIINKDYLYLYLQSELFQKELASVSARSAQAGFSKADISPFDIVIPPIPEQKRIVSILDTVFADLEQARAKTEQNLKNARDLFDSYLQQVFSQDREVAAKSGWVTKYISDVICKTKTVDPRKSPESEFLYVDVSGVSNQTLEITDSTKLAGKDAPSRARRVITEGDIIFATVRPTLRRIAVVPSHLDGEVCSTGYFVFQPKSELYNRYLYYFLQSDTFMVEMEKLQKGASYPAVNDSQVKSRLISYPSIPEQKRIVETLDSLNNAVNELKATYTKKLNSIDDLKKSILQKAFSGELTTTAT